MARSRDGEAIGPDGKTPAARRRLRKFTDEAKRVGDLARWRRGRALIGYIEGRRVVELAAEAGVTRGSGNLMHR